MSSVLVLRTYLKHFAIFFSNGLSSFSEHYTQHELLSHLTLDDDPEYGVAILSTTAPSYNESISGTDTCLLVPTACDTHSMSVSFENSRFSHETQTASVRPIGSHLSAQNSTALGMTTIHDAGSDLGDAASAPRRPDY